VVIYLHITSIWLCAAFFFLLLYWAWPSAYPVCEGCEEVG